MPVLPLLFVSLSSHLANAQVVAKPTLNASAISMAMRKATILGKSRSTGGVERMVMLDPADCASCNQTLAAALDTARTSASIGVCLLRPPRESEKRQLTLSRISSQCVVSRELAAQVRRTSYVSRTGQLIWVLP